MFKWSDDQLQNVTRRIIYKYLWAVPHFEFEDLLQEAAMIHTRLVASHGPDAVREHLASKSARKATQSSMRATWFALYKFALKNRLLNYIRRQRRRVDEAAVDSEILECMSGGQWAADIRRLELAYDLQKVPGIAGILAESSWYAGVLRKRAPRKFGDGTVETREALLGRLAGRSYRRHYNYVEQLALVV